MSDRVFHESSLDRTLLLERYRNYRRRSASIFDLVADDAYYARPIPLRNPIVFYEGHLPAFNINTLVKKGLKQEGIDSDLEVLFERGIDPDSEAQADASQAAAWPRRDEVLAYAAAADARIEDAITREEIIRDDDVMRRRGHTLFTILEHELMHQETLLYMWHRLPPEQKKQSVDDAVRETVSQATSADHGVVRVPAGLATLGAERENVLFGWDNEFQQHVVEVPEFEIDIQNVTNGQFLEFVDAGGYETPELWGAAWQWRRDHEIEHPLFWERHGGSFYWRTMFGLIPLPMNWPVYATLAESSAYARWKGRRLMTEAEYHRAAFGTPDGDERPYPWGNEPAALHHGNFGFQHWDPVPVGSYPTGASAWGIHDLVGNGWEWTSTPFHPFPGFEPMPSYPVYSTDFFDDQHFVIKGASPATATPLIRRSFRNWFRFNYPYLYATFRTVK